LFENPTGARPVWARYAGAPGISTREELPRGVRLIASTWTVLRAMGTTPAEFSNYIAKERERWIKVVKASGVQLEY
jgi:hypothetical protein